MSTAPSGQDIFTRISDPSEKVRLFMDLAKSRGELIAKRPDPSADAFVLMAYEYINGKILCRIMGAQSTLPPSGELILTCFVGGEKYFLQTQYQYSGDQLSLSTDAHLYHLQRREDYRIRIPQGFKALYEVVSINGQTKKIPIPLMDLSGGGCRIQIDTKVLPLKLQDEIKGHLFLPDRPPIPVLGSVCHLRTDSMGKEPVICGVQFVGLTDQVKNRIIAVVLDLYRQHFSGRN